MLGKLIKYEFKATMRTFLPIYTAILVIASLDRLMYGKDIIRYENKVGEGILFTLFISLIVITVVVIVQRFKKNLLGDEGYLMFTLPVRTESLILSKIIVTIIWSIMSCIVVVAMLFILYGMPVDLKDFTKRFITPLGENKDELHFFLAMIKTTFFFFSFNLVFIFEIYTSLSIAQIPKLAKHRGIFAIGAFIGINTVIMRIYVMMAEEIAGYIGKTSFMAECASNVVASVVMFFIVRWLLSKHLNLE